MDTVFYLVLNMSLTGCVAIALLLLLRRIRALPRRVVYPLWALALARLLLPFSVSAPWSLFNFTGGLVRRLVNFRTLTGQESPAGTDVWYAMNMIGAAREYAPVSYSDEALRRVFAVGRGVWIVGAAALLLAISILYVMTLAELAKAVPIRGRLWRSEALLSPVLTGIFRPKILLPPGLDPDSPEGGLVLAHEDVHRRRLDNLWRALAILTACVHWFNPLVWLMLRAFFTDMELSCDEAVLRRAGDGAETRKTYATALLRYAEDKQFLLSTAFGRGGVRLRVVHVLHYKRMTLLGAAASAAFWLAAALALLTNPMGVHIW